MKNIRRFTLLSLVVFIGAWFFTCTMPTEMQVKGSPSFDLPAGKSTHTLSDLFDFNSLLSQSLDESVNVEIDQSEVITDFELPPVTRSDIPEPPVDATISFTEDDSKLSITTTAYTEIEFYSGMLNVSMDLTGLSANIDVFITDIAIVDSNNTVIAESTNNELMYHQGSGTQNVLFDLSGKTLPNEFAFTMVMNTANGDISNEFNIVLTPSITNYMISRISGVSFDPISGSDTVDDFQIDLPEFLTRAIINTGNLLIGVETPEDWAGFKLTLNSSIDDSEGNENNGVETEESTDTAPQLSMPLDNVEFGGDPLIINWGYDMTDVGDTETVFTFDNDGIARIDGSVELEITDMTFVVDGDGIYWEDEEGNDTLFEAEEDLFERDASEIGDPDGDITQLLDGVLKAAIYMENIQNTAGLGLKIEIVDEDADSDYRFEQIIDLEADNEGNVADIDIELTDADINYIKNNPFTPAVKVFIPGGALPINPEGELSFTMWMHLETDIDYTIPIGEEEEE